MSPDVSIIIPHFERLELLRETLDSVRRQSAANWEIIIVDDGSSDAVWQGVQALADGARIQTLQRKAREKGPSACRNIGAEAARGQWLIFLDSDDLLAPWCLAQRIVTMNLSDEDFLVFPVALFSETIGDQSELWNALARPGSDLQRFLHSDGPWHTSSPIWRKEAFLKIGGFNERVFYGDDSDLHTRALLRGLTYRKMCNALPDAFVRRSAQPRITRESGERLFQNRQQRLAECSRALREFNASAACLDAWEGQYFVEAEFLMFNMPQASAAVRQTLDDMAEAFPGYGLRHLIARLYCALTLRCKAKAYLVVRVARRLAMALLPASYFAQPTPTRERQMTDATLAEIRARLQQSAAQF